MGTTNFDVVQAAGFIGDVTGTLAAFAAVERTATAAPGGTTGVIADGGGAFQVVAVTSDNADKVITLPAPVPGTVVVLINGATGYELRSSAPATVAINGGSGANAESAIAASKVVVALCVSATAWQAFSVALSTVDGAAA